MRGFILRSLWVGGMICLTVSASAWERRTGARPMGMGDAFSALADDLNVLNYNPAGLGLEKNIEASLEYANLYPGLDDGSVQENHLAYAQNLYTGGAVGFAWNNRALAGAYSENELLAAYAFRPSDSMPLWIGAGCKLFYLAYTEENSLRNNGYFFQGHEKWQWGADLGAVLQAESETSAVPGIRLGLSLLNLNQPDFGLRAADLQPVEIRLGSAATFGEWDGALDVLLRGGDFQLHAGAEKWFQNRTWGVRAGILNGGGTALTWTAGGSFQFNLGFAQTRCDYAFLYSWGGIQETAGVHRLSMNLVFPLPSLEELKKQEDARKKQEISEQERLRVRAHQLFEQTRNLIIQFEKQASLPELRERIKEFNSETVGSHELLERNRYQEAIQGFERIQQDLKYLQEQVERENETRRQAKLKHEELVQRVKEYLFRRLLVYASTRQKIKQMREHARGRLDEELFQVEQSLFEARNAIIQRRNVREFLTRLRMAVQQFEDIRKEADANTGAVLP